MATEGEVLLRLVLACILGGLIGYERQSRRKSAGLRTNILVCLGSCLIMILSQEVYSAVEGRTNADPARLAAQVVSGIGFLGAGTIMKEGLTVKGLTTAACLWVVAGVGLAVGAGFYGGALFTAFLVFATLGILSRLDEWVSPDKSMVITIETDDLDGQIKILSGKLEKAGISIKNLQVKSNYENNIIVTILTHHFEVKRSGEIAEKLLRLDGVHRVKIE
jgi:putative Mg2+ transporter-C (MgtC) family protein